MADGFYGRFGLGQDGVGLATFANYTRELNVWHVLTINMIGGTLYGYFDGLLIGSYTISDTTPGNTDLVSIQALASWETNNGFDWMQANNSPSPPPPYFTVSANPTSIYLLAGQSGNSTIQIESQAGFTGTVTLTPSVSPPGPLVQMNPSTITLSNGGSATSALIVSTQASTTPGTYSIIATGMSGNLSEYVTLAVTVNPASSDFSISDSARSITIPLGSEKQTVIQADSFNGFTGEVNLTAIPSSPAVACWFTTLTSTSTVYVSPGYPAYEYPTCGAYGSAGNYLVTFTGTGNGLSHSTGLQVMISDFSISASSVSFTSPTGNGNVTLSSLAGLVGPVSLTVSSPPAVSVSCPSSATLELDGTTTISCSYSSTAPGTYNVTITGSFVCGDCYYDGTDSHSVTVDVNVSQPSHPDFYVSASPNGLAVTPGSSTTSTITLTSLAGFTGGVSLAASVLPAGPSVSLNPATITLTSGGTGISTLTLSTTSNNPTGSYTITITATSGSLSHSTTISLTVSSSHFTISDIPTSQAIPFGSEMQTAIQVDSVNGFSGNVSLVATPSATAVACWFAYTLTNAATVSVPTGGYGYQWPTCGAYGAPGSYTVTITGTSGSLTYSIVVPVTVMDYSIAASSTSFTQGSSGNATVSLTSLSGLSGPVSLRVSQTPGVTVSCPSSVNLVSDGTDTATCSFSSASPGSYAVTITGTFACSGCYYDGTDSHSATANVTVTSTDPPVSSRTTFQGTTIATSGSLTITSGEVSGTVSIVATKNSTGTVLFSKSYTISKVIVLDNQARFLLNVQVSPYPLSADITVRLEGGAWSASVTITRQLDLANRGYVDIVDVTVATNAFNSVMGNPSYNPAADVSAAGTVNIVDVTIIESFFNARDFS